MCPGTALLAVAERCPVGEGCGLDFAVEVVAQSCCGAETGLMGYFVDGQPDSGRIEGFFDEMLRETGRPAIDLWLGAHTHTHPDDCAGGRSHIETKWGVNFVNVSALTRYHGRRNSVPMSRLFTFTDGSGEALVRCYLLPVGCFLECPCRPVYTEIGRASCRERV